MESVTLDAVDRGLAHALQIDGRAPFSRIASVLGVSDRTVARRYHRLRSAGALRVIGHPESRRMGMVFWLVRLRCVPDAAAAVAGALAERPDTSWVALAAGGTEITCVTRANAGPLRGSLLLPKLPRSSRITDVTAQCLLRPVAGLDGWRGRTSELDEEQQTALRRPRDRTDGTPPATADRVVADGDRRMLEVLAEDGRAPVGELAAATGWSESTVRRRLEELRAGGLLSFDVEIDPVLYGYTCEAMLWLAVAPARLNAVAEALSGHPEVAYAAATSGRDNLAAFLVCRDADALYDYLSVRIGALDGVLGAETTPLTRHVKRSGTSLFARSAGISRS
ncbi:Lrp/AsnC family transcriptional regulator [Streptomyces sp. URMC 127]|uniref:Lrp/AsnC family transcriptional regulator n=1 Tax=Streptomyces sp. URMC 127 TaxID=3423402 RepID=UPI003F1D4F7E